MSLWSWFTGTEDSATQAAAVQAHHDALQASIDQHQAAGDLTQQQLDFASQFNTNAGPALDSGFLNSWNTRDQGNSQPGGGSLVIDALILLAALGAGWAFFAFGGPVWVRAAFKTKNYVVLGAIAFGAGIWAYVVYSYSKKISADFGTFQQQVSSLFKF